VSLYDMADAAASCARYLAQNGWTPDVDRAGKRAVIWRYNRSEVYIDTILALDHHLRAPDDPPTAAAPKRARPRRR
jgi:membrane-bound lytic murein transglycosylase B